MTRRLVPVALAALLAGASACESTAGTGPCSPGQSMACTCGPGETGTQACAKGTGTFGPCVCGDAGTSPETDGATASDAGPDGAVADAGVQPSGDAGPGTDTSVADVGSPDVGESVDVGGLVDAGTVDAGPLDAGADPDTGPPDAGSKPDPLAGCYKTEDAPYPDGLLPGEPCQKNADCMHGLCGSDGPITEGKFSICLKKCGDCPGGFSPACAEDDDLSSGLTFTCVKYHDSTGAPVSHCGRRCDSSSGFPGVDSCATLDAGYTSCDDDHAGKQYCGAHD